MHIVNAMFSKGLGGIEQSLVDYCEALKMQGHRVTAIISRHAEIKAQLLDLHVNIIEVKICNKWDFFARAYLKKILVQLSPSAVIVHGNRAVTLMDVAEVPVIGVTHNYSIKRLIGLDAILATTEDLKRAVIAAGQPGNKVIKLPNMARVKVLNNESAPVKTQSAPVVIGAMGRFVKKKGFDVFIRAIAELKGQGLACRAIIAGTGEEEDNLKKLAVQLKLNKDIEFAGWIENKEQFFDNIDIFCIPSIHEPFGIILLEAFAHKKPVVVTDSEGPSEIAQNNIDAIIVPKGDSKALASAITRLAGDSALSAKIAQNGFAKALNYDIEYFSASLDKAIRTIVAK